MKKITMDQLKRIQEEGLVLRGCGGDPQAWVDSINTMLTQEEILKNGSVFQDVSVFENGGQTNLLFNMDGVDLDMGKLAMWRLLAFGQFGATWLSDYLPNQLGMEMGQESTADNRPDCPMIGADGNVFNLMGITARTLKENDRPEAAKEMRERVTSCGSYDEALAIMMEYVNPVSTDEMDESPDMSEQTFM